MVGHTSRFVAPAAVLTVFASNLIEIGPQWWRGYLLAAIPLALLMTLLGWRATERAARWAPVIVMLLGPLLYVLVSNAG